MRRTAIMYKTHKHALPVSVSFDFKFKKDRMLTLSFGEQTTLIKGWPLREFFPFLLKSQREKYISEIEIPDNP